MMKFSIPRPNGFSLSAATQFYAGFTPGTGMAAAGASDTELTLTFRLDDSFRAASAKLREEDARLLVACEGTKDEERVTKQLGRMLGLDQNGDAWLAVGKRDPVVGRLQASFPGFFTAAKASPYDAACWSVIAPRTSIAHAAKIKMALAEEHGDAVAIDGVTHHVFPAPAKLFALEAFPGLSAEKIARLHSVAEAALDGRLDAEYLRGLGEAAALRELMAIRGIGAWSAGHIYYRGAAPVNALPLSEPRVLHGFAAAYALPDADEKAFRHIAEGWRPFRMWVCILFSRHLARIGQWNKPGLTKERRRASNLLLRRA